MSVEILPVTGIGEITPGTDLAGVIGTAAPWLRDGDVLVVTSKIVSKAEGRLVPLPVDPAGRERVRADTVTAETGRPVAARGSTRIVATRHGFVMAAAGVDSSNVRDQLVLLPTDPDRSARALRAALAHRFGHRVAVIVSDTMGRPWRTGQTDVALGAAGITPLWDHRGGTDRYGNPLEVTQSAVVDELAGATELVRGKTDGVPVAVVRGVPGGLLTADDGPGVVASLVREPDQDMFRLGTAEARAAGLRAAAALSAPAGPTDPAPPPEPAPPPDPAAVERALAVVTPVAGSALTLAADPPGIRPPAGASTTVRCTVATGDAVDPPRPVDPVALVRLGEDVHRLRAALAAEGLATSVTYPAAGTVLVQVTPAG